MKLTEWIEGDDGFGDDLCYYEAATETLKGTQKSKAKRFVREGCISYNKAEQIFYIHPIPTYNKTTYEVKKTDEYLSCNCQWYVKNQSYCSHIYAVLLWLKKRREE